MIKTIESENIMIGKASDLESYLGKNGFCGRFKLPLFSTKLVLIEDYEAKNNLLCLIMKTNFYFDNTNNKEISLELLEKINKAWNEFYE